MLRFPHFPLQAKRQLLLRSTLVGQIGMFNFLCGYALGPWLLSTFVGDIRILGDRIRDLGKGAFGMWAFIAHGGLSKPTVRTEPLNLFGASKNMGAIVLEKKKNACGKIPASYGLPTFV